MSSDDAHRTTWGQNLTAQLDLLGISRKDLVHRLSILGVSVSEQAVGYWCRGETSPTPKHQAAIAHVLRVPVHVLFPVTFTAAPEGTAA